MRSRRSRDGVGALIIIVLVLLLVVAVMGIGQSFFSSHVLDKAARSSYGNVALGLAESAVQEILLALQLEVNRPGNSKFLGFRGQTQGTGDNGFVILSSSQSSGNLPLYATQRLLEQPEFDGYDVEEVLAEVSFRRPLNGLTYEQTGLLRVMARVSNDRIGTVIRGVDLYKDFKVQLVGPPRPFDQVSFFVTDPERLLASDIDEANQRMRDSYESLQNLVQKSLPELKDAAQQLGSDGSSIQARIDQALGKLGPWVPQNLDKPPGDDGVWAHYFKDPVLLLAVGPIQDLSKLYLRPPLEAAREAIGQAADDLDKKAKAFKAEAQSASSNPLSADKGKLKQLATEVVEAAEALGVRHHERLEVYRQFQAAFFEKTGGAYRRWKKAFLPKLGLGRWRRKVTFAVSSQLQFDQLYQRLGDTINGVVVADCNLKIEGDWNGKAAVIVTGRLEMKDVKVQDPARSALTVMGLGSVEIDGPRCDAAVIIGENGACAIAGGTQIYGELVFAGGVSRPDQLKGQLERNPHLFSGNSEDPQQKLDYLLVSISPQVRMRGVIRR